MKPVVVAPLVALALAGGGAGTYFWVTSGGSVEEVPPPPLVQASPTPAPSATFQPSPTPMPAPTADNWVTYVDPELGFSFSYPPQLTDIKETSQQGLPGGENARFIEFLTADGERGVAVIVTPVDGLALDDWVNEYTACGGDSGAQEEEVHVGESRALRCPIDQLNQPNPSYFLKWSTYVIELSGNVSGSKEGAGHPAVLSDAEFEHVVQSVAVPPSQ